MREVHSKTRWNDHLHKSLYPSLEHSDLQEIERKTGHSWERTTLGEVKFYPLENQCQGPLCESCGFMFCVECRLAVDPALCTCKPAISSGPIPHVYIAAAEQYSQPVATPLVSSSLRDERGEPTSTVARLSLSDKIA